MIYSKLNIKYKKNPIKNVVKYSSVTPANLYFTVPLQVAVRFRDAISSNISVHFINSCQRSSFWSGGEGFRGMLCLIQIKPYLASNDVLTDSIKKMII